jgi:3-oxoacyl-[acyl-carrier protein] reductase
MPASQRVGVVTGSSSGIGRAIALRLLGVGYSVILNYSADDERARATLAACRQISSDVELVRADVSDSESVSALVRSAVDGFGRLDVLVNNAARVIDKPALEMTEEEWDTVLGVNLKGAFLCSQYAARQMLKQDDNGVIINIGASTGIRGRRNGVNTCASKAGLMVMTQCLALELAPKIRVNTIIPGLIMTEETEQRFGLGDPTVRRTREESIPMQRLGRPEDVADAVMLMLADESRFITGQRIVVDGGQNMWLRMYLY